jgi:hypothetical protein
MPYWPEDLALIRDGGTPYIGPDRPQELLTEILTNGGGTLIGLARRCGMTNQEARDAATSLVARQLAHWSTYKGRRYLTKGANR